MQKLPLLLVSLLGYCVTVDAQNDPADAIKQKDSAILHDIIAPAISQTNAPDWEQLRKQIGSQYDNYYADRLVIEGKIRYYFAKDWPQFTSNLVSFTEKYVLPSDVKQLNGNAQYIGQYSSDKSELQKALAWSESAIKSEPANAEYKDTHELLEALLNNNNIHFDEQSTWAQLKAKAKKEQKYIFLDCYTTWCGPCREMSRTIFTRKRVADFFNTNFINVHLQLDSTGKDNALVKKRYADAKYVADSFHVAGYPTLMFFSYDGKLIYQNMGMPKADDLMKRATAATHYKSYAAQVEKFRKRALPMADCKTFADSLKNLELDHLASDAANIYIKDFLLKKNEADIFNTEFLSFVKKYTTSTTDTGFILFFKDSARVGQVLGSRSVQGFLMNTIANSDLRPVLAKSTLEKIDWEKLEAEETAKYGFVGRLAILQDELNMLFTRGGMGVQENDLKKLPPQEWAKLENAFVRYYTYVGDYNVFAINTFAWPIFTNSHDASVLAFAAKVMYKYKDNNDPNELDTYANLLYKSGDKQAGLLWEQKALELETQHAEQEKRNASPIYAEKIEKMKNGQPTWPAP